MQNNPRVHLIARIAASAAAGAAPADPAARTSILSLAAASYGARPSGDMTIPTGFDPHAAALFEAIVEAAYVVANADGHFDDAERHAFEHIVVEACGGTVAPGQIAALVSELGQRLRDDGIDRRVASVAITAAKKEHAHEVLRVAALMSHASDGVSGVERDVLTQLATRCGLPGSDVDAAIAHALEAMASATTGGA